MIDIIIIDQYVICDASDRTPEDNMERPNQLRTSPEDSDGDEDQDEAALVAQDDSYLSRSRWAKA